MTTAPLVRPASTVLLVRPDQQRFSVFLLRRNRRLAFMPTAWVFPGGRVDAADALNAHPKVVGGQRALTRMGLEADRGLPYLVAGVRETFEESGRWLGPGDPGSKHRDRLNGGETTLGEVLDASGAVADLDRLHPWSWWITPEAEPRRYDTRFFVARVDGDGGTHDRGETVDSAWLPIDEAVARAEAGELPMAPPTWWTLKELQRHDSVDDVLAADRPTRPICPILRGDPSSLSLVLPGHADHAESAIPGLPVEVRFAQGRWWAETN